MLQVVDFKTDGQYENYVTMELSIKTGYNAEPAQHVRVKRITIEVKSQWGLPM